jgi:hypothetical protein
MTLTHRLLAVSLAATLFCFFLNAQQTVSPQAATVPRLVNFSGKATDAQGKVVSGTAGVTLAIYKDQYEGVPLWTETQNVQPDAKGNYTVQLGATKSEGLPLDLFTSGEGRWLGIRINGGEEQPRVLLLSVPYALKAADAETVGGLPPSAFVLAVPPNGGAPGNTSGNPATTSASASSLASSSVTTTGGTVNTLPLWTTGTNIQSSVITQSGTKIGINTTTPSATLDVKGGETLRGLLYLTSSGTATAAAGKNSYPLDIVATAFNSATSTSLNQTFQWMAEPVANNTANPSGTLNLLFGMGASAPSETGVKISSKGLITFASGQTFPGTGPGTVTSVGLSAPGSDFTVSGSPVTNSGTLKFAWTVPPTNADTANAIVKRDASGNFSATSITATGELVAQATVGNGNAILASSANPTATVVYGGASSSTGATWGVEGETFSADPGASGVVGRGHKGGFSVIGLNDVGGGGAAVYGQMVSPITSNFGSWPAPAGVWGSTGVLGYAGVLGTADDGYAGIFLNNSPGTFTTFQIASFDSRGYLFSAYNVSDAAYCNIDSTAHLTCSGGTAAVVPLDSGTRKVGMPSITSPENWSEDFGSAQLANGVAVVQLDRDFIQTVNSEKAYNVFVTPYGDCKGLYVTNRTANSFEVHELGSGTTSLSFGYRITALRRKYETVRFEDHTNDPDPRKMLEQMHKAKPASSSGPASVRPAPQPVAGVPVAQLSNK